MAFNIIPQSSEQRMSEQIHLNMRVKYEANCPTAKPRLTLGHSTGQIPQA